MFSRKKVKAPISWSCVTQFSPMIGKSSAEGGRKSEMTRRNTACESNTVTSRDTFSPLSGGRRNPEINRIHVKLTIMQCGATNQQTCQVRHAI